MPRPTVILCLIAALTGPLLYQAEAADDIARWMTRTLDGRAVIDPVDGGVGDEPYLASGTKVSVDLGAATAACPILGVMERLPSTDFLAAPGGADPPGTVAGFDPFSGGQWRQAWLQLFRF
jgi:hypothetical protein